jgi:hypothetical protein
MINISLDRLLNELGVNDAGFVGINLKESDISNSDSIIFSLKSTKKLKRIKWLSIINQLIVIFDARYTPITPLTGERKTGVHSGTFGQVSITNDYYYICVQTGTTSTAIWKKIVMFESI